MSDDLRQRLSFVVIGAQKAGTTTLHNALRNGGGVLVPQSKEAPFFAVDADYARGEAWFFETHFPNAGSDSILGTVTPHYMYVEPALDRLYEHNPELRVLAILRDPLDRAVSHYVMNRRRGVEGRSIDDALRSAAADDDPHGYLRRGCYGRLLTRWVSRFGIDKLLLLDFDWLADDPQLVALSLHESIGAVVDVGDLGRVANASSRLAGTEPLKQMLGSRPFRPLRRLVPVRARQAVWLRLESGISVGGRQRTRPSAEVVGELQTWFASDLDVLAKLWAEAAPGRLPRWAAPA